LQDEISLSINKKIINFSDQGQKLSLTADAISFFLILSPRIKSGGSGVTRCRICRTLPYVVYSVSFIIINPIQTEGGGILPARTLDVDNFFNKEAKATKLGEFS